MYVSSLLKVLECLQQKRSVTKAGGNSMALNQERNKGMFQVATGLDPPVLKRMGLGLSLRVRVQGQSGLSNS